MIWPFPKKVRPESQEVRQALDAQTRAVETMREVNSRQEEVDLYYKNLAARKRKNNFGPALMQAMERRGYVPADS